MCGGGLSKLPNEEIRGIIAEEERGFVFHWEAFYNFSPDKIKKLLKKVNPGNEPLAWVGQKHALIAKIKALNKERGLPGVKAV